MLVEDIDNYEYWEWKIAFKKYGNLVKILLNPKLYKYKYSEMDPLLVTSKHIFEIKLKGRTPISVYLETPIESWDKYYLKCVFWEGGKEGNINVYRFFELEADKFIGFAFDTKSDI